MRTIAASVIAVLVITVAIIALGIGLGWPFSLRDQFRLTNSSGKPITVTSHHTGQSFRIGEGKTLVVAHSNGRITIRQDEGERWTYNDLNTFQFQGTRYAAIRDFPFPFGASLTINLELGQDGRVNILPSSDDTVREHVTQPVGFPLKPSNETTSKSQK